MINIKNLDKYFNKGKQNELHVVNNVNLELPSTGLICILGESGSGKTTLMNCVGGLDDYKSGNIEAFGTTIKKSNTKAYEKIRNNHYGYIFQNYYLLSDQTVYNNIKIALNMYELSEQDKEKRIDSVLDAVGMAKYKKRVVSQLSGGQQQRIAIARALVKSPEVIFADEPTGNLDELNTMKIMSILKKVSKTCLIVLVTHEKRIAHFFADRIIEVSDGQIKSDTQLETTNNSYSYSDDNNIYLKELEKHQSKDGYIEYNYYSEDEPKKFYLDIAYENGKIYITPNSDVDIIMLTPTSEKKMIDDYRPKIEMKDVENIDYNIEKLTNAKSPKLPFKELIKLAGQNIKLFGKRQIFIFISLIIMSILISIAVQDVFTLANIDTGNIARNDSHYLTVTIDRGKHIIGNQYDEEFYKIYDNFLSSSIKPEISLNNNINLEYNYVGFEQVEDVKATMTGFNYVSLENLKKSDLVYGTMPKLPNEIVVDIQVINRFMRDNKLLKVLFTDPKAFLNKDFNISRKQYPYKIVGICDTNEADVYMDKYTCLGVVGWCDQLTNLSNIQNAYPGKYDSVTLKENENLVSEIYRAGGEYRSKYLQSYSIKDRYSKEYPADFVVNDDSYDSILRNLCCYSKTFKVYTDNKQEVKDYFKNVAKEDKEGKLQIVVTDDYAKDLQKMKEQRDVKLDARMIITLTIIVVCLVILYFTMKSNTLKNIKNIAVYRLLGIKKSSISMLYALEIIMISTYTSLIGVLATTVVTKFLSSIDSLELNVVYPWYGVVGTIVLIYVINIIISIIPVMSIVKLPPAQIVSKYDM